MASPDDDSGSTPLLPKLSRRAFFTGAGASALSATLTQSVAEAAATASPAAVGPEPSALSLSINGRTVTVHVDPATTLAEVLRNHLGMTGTKIGCDRGACTVWLDGEVAASCMTLAFDARGRKVTTIEGLARGDASSTSCRGGRRRGWRSCASCWRRPIPTSPTRANGPRAARGCEPCNRQR